MTKKRKKCILPYAGNPISPEVCGEYGSKVFGFNRTYIRREQNLLGECIPMLLVRDFDPVQKSSRPGRADCVQKYMLGSR